MSRNVELADPGMIVGALAKTMRDKDLGAIPVVENDRLIGMVTDRDIVTRAVAEDKSPRAVTAREVMSDGIVYCYDQDTLEQAAKKMSQHRVRRLPVINSDKRLVGVISVGEFAQVDAPEEMAEALEGITHPHTAPGGLRS